MTFFYPEYDKQKTLYWVIWVFVLLYVIGAGIYLGKQKNYERSDVVFLLIFF